MHDPTLNLSEPAKQALERLEAQWRRTYVRHGQGKRWQAISLAKAWQKSGLCTSELQAWQVLEELGEARLLSFPPGVRLSPHYRVNARLGLSDGRCERIVAALPVVDAMLALSPERKMAWGPALEGTLGDWSRNDQQQLAAGLEQLSTALPAAYELTRFVASARYLLGSSKLLEALPSELVRAFGIELNRFAPAETWLLASVPARPEGLLLIENPQSFTHASRMGIDRRLALVCSYGYGLSLGEALGGIDRVQLVGQGAEQWTLTTLLRLPNLTYWGDLDPEGLRIYQRLQQRLPDLRLSALLEPMIEALGEHRGHPLDALTGKGGQREAGDWRRGLDQEWLSDDCLTALAGKALVPEQQAHLLACLGP